MFASFRKWNPNRVIEMAKKAAKKTSTPKTSQGKSQTEDSLSLMLEKAAELFNGASAVKKILFQLGYKKGKWKFEVVNCWTLWIERGFASEFSGDTPEAAVQRFLDYVAKHRIHPPSLSLPD